MLSTAHRSLALLIVVGGVLAYTPVQGEGTRHPYIHVNNYARVRLNVIESGPDAVNMKGTAAFLCARKAIAYEKTHKHRYPYQFFQNYSSLGILPVSPQFLSTKMISYDMMSTYWQCNGTWLVVYSTDSDGD